MVKRLVFGLLLALSVSVNGDEKIPLMIQGHAHNDYYHERPLEDALECLFCSIEVDVFLENGKFLVGHDRDELREDRTLERLYLDPLKKRVLDGQGYVYKEKIRITLFIDIKSYIRGNRNFFSRTQKGFSIRKDSKACSCFASKDFCRIYQAY